MRVDDSIVGVVLIVFAAAVIAHAQSFPTLGGMDVGPALFPTVIGGGMILCGAAMIAQSALARRRGAGAPWVVRADWARRWRPWANAALVLIAVVAFALLLDPLGYHLAALGALVVLLLWLRVRPVTAVPVAIVTTAATHELFYGWLRVPLPWGLLEPVAW
jgi:putative tricarboxylic transport membrane protein